MVSLEISVCDFKVTSVVGVAFSRCCYWCWLIGCLLPLLLGLLLLLLLWFFRWRHTHAINFLFQFLFQTFSMSMQFSQSKITANLRAMWYLTFCCALIFHWILQWTSHQCTIFVSIYYYVTLRFHSILHEITRLSFVCELHLSFWGQIECREIVVVGFFFFFLLCNFTWKMSIYLFIWG